MFKNNLAKENLAVMYLRLSKEDIEKSRKICESTGAEFKVRSFAKGR